MDTANATKNSHPRRSATRALLWFVSGVVFAGVVLAPAAFLFRDELRQLAQEVLYVIRGSEGAPVPATAEVNSSAAETRETNSLPLLFSTTSLVEAGFVPFAGHIEAVDRRLVVMSRVGRFYAKEDNVLTDLAVSLPNNIEAYTRRYGAPAADAMRALSFAVDCDAAILFAAYIRYEPDDNHVGKYVISSHKFDCAAKLPFSSDDWTTVYESVAIDEADTFNAQAAGGGLEVTPDYVFAAVGFSSSTSTNAEGVPIALDANSERGKVLRISRVDGRAVIFTSGHRNLQDIHYDKVSGELISVEQGPKGGDEINLLLQNSSFGWPVQNYGVEYNSYQNPPFAAYEQDGPYANDRAAFSTPIFSFVPAVAADSIEQVEGFHLSWNGDYLVGGLKGQSIYRVKILRGHAIYVEPIWIGHRVRSIAMLQETIQLLTDDGLIIEIRPDKVKFEADLAGDDLVAKDPAFSRCTQCHGFADTTPMSPAPSLLDLLGRDIASTPFEGYSKSLQEEPGEWTPEKLKAFLRSPRTLAVGSTMPDLGLSDGEVDLIIKKLE